MSDHSQHQSSWDPTIEYFETTSTPCDTFGTQYILGHRKQEDKHTVLCKSRNIETLLLHTELYSWHWWRPLSSFQQAQGTCDIHQLEQSYRDDTASRPRRVNFLEWKPVEEVGAGRSRWEQGQGSPQRQGRHG